MANLSEVKAESDWGSASARINQNFNNINTELAGIKNATTKNKGYFKTDAALKLAYPTAKPGDIAYVGLNYPYQIWEWSNGWQDTKQTGGAENVSLVDYYTKTDIDSQQTEQNAIIDNALVEYNVSKFHPTSGINGSNKYTLETAIAQVPSKYRSVGIKCAFINASGKPECWKYQGGSWTAGNFTKEADGGNKILIWLTDVSTTRKQVALSERKTLLQISYKNSDGDIVNEQYIGTSLADTEWVKDTNWQKIPDQKQISQLYTEKAVVEEKDISSTVLFTDNKLLQSNDLKPQFGEEQQISSSLDTSVSQYIEIPTGFNKLKISVFKSNTTTDNGCVLYDENKKALKGYRFENMDSRGTYILNLRILSAYKYIKTSIRTSEKSDFVCILYKVKEEGILPELEKKIPDGEILFTEGNTEEPDLSIKDSNGNTLAEFKNGHFRTKYFDSSKLGETGNSNKLKIDRDLICFGHSIWDYDRKTLPGSLSGSSSENPTGVGGGVIARGYQTLIMEEFKFNSYSRKMCLSGQALGGDRSIITQADSSNLWTTSSKSLWLVDTTTNDFKTNVPIGVPDDYINRTGINTFYGALRELKERITEYGGDAKVIISNACRRNNAGYTSTSKNSEGHTLIDYEKAILYAACINDWFFVDQRDCGIKDETINMVTVDGLHLNNVGYNIAVKPWINAITMCYNIDNNKLN